MSLCVPGHPRIQSTEAEIAERLEAARGQLDEVLDQLRSTVHGTDVQYGETHDSLAALERFVIAADARLQSAGRMIARVARDNADFAP